MPLFQRYWEQDSATEPALFEGVVADISGSAGDDQPVGQPVAMIESLVADVSQRVA